MPDRPDAALQEKLNERLRFYEDLGLGPFYRDRGVSTRRIAPAPAVAPETLSVVFEESTLRKAVSKLTPAVNTVVPEPAARLPILPTATGLSLFEASDKILDDTLLKTREDLGECTRCKLHKTRNKIVFGDGSPKADLVFIGEGPGADEDAQGLPFVGRAGKLLTQMIEAMGLRRGDVYICNVVKCRPPENRQPEKDEVTACSPFLFRQLDVLKPKVIVCLGSTAAQTLLQTNRGISHFRGEWLDFRGYKMLATYHPAYLLRNPGAKGEVWKDLQKVMAELGLEVKKNKAK
jgi:uracil-DNA glycosylase family 4